MLSGKKKWRRKPRVKNLGGRMDTCICMAESLHCSPETITTLLIGYSPIQNKKLKKKKESVGENLRSMTVL